MVFGADTADISLFLDGDLIPTDSTFLAYDFYGKVICIE